MSDPLADLIAADPRFWCETCHGMHPLSQHQTCRENAAQAWIQAAREQITPPTH